MNKDFLIELKYLGITARIKRLNDSLFYSIKELYKKEKIDIEPSWHLLLLILKKEKRMTMFDISKALNLSKPAISKMIKKMQHLNYVQIISDSKDSRKKIVELSRKSEIEFPKFERVWEAGQKAIKELLEENEHFIQAFTKLEEMNTSNNLAERASKYLK